MSFVLVVVAAITLVIGLLQSGLGIIYVSIGCSVLAGIVLATAVLRGRPEPRGAGAPMPQRSTAGAQPAPAPNTWVSPDPTPAPLPSSPAAEPVTAGTSAGALGEGGVAVADRDDRTESLDRVEVEEFAPDDDFPIHDYDRLRATEILPMLAELSDEQLEAVEERERSGKNRAMVLNRVEAQRQSRVPQAWDADDEGWDAAAEAAPEPTRPEPAVLSGSGSESLQGPMSQGPAPAAAVGEFPIPDFDDLKALEVLGRLPGLTVSELHLVRRREEDGFRRAMVLNRVDRLIEEAPPEPEPVVVAPRRRSTTRATSVKAPAKRAVAAKAVAKGGRGAATAATARKRTSATKAAAPVTKTATAPTKRASATTRKAVAETRSAPAKKVAVTRKTVPTKRATKKR